MTTKTLQEKAQFICEQLNLPKEGAAYTLIRAALIAQDRDTRHACAERVAALEGDDDTLNRAHFAVMNTVIE